MPDPRLDHLGVVYLELEDEALPVRWQPAQTGKTIRELLLLDPPEELSYALTDHGMISGEDLLVLREKALAGE